jgi:hypothetical protein
MHGKSYDMKKDGVPSETKSHIASRVKRFFIIALGTFIELGIGHGHGWVDYAIILRVSPCRLQSASPEPKIIYN